MLLGRVKATTGGVVLVQLGQRTVGTIALTDLYDHWKGNVLEGVEVGTVVRVCVVQQGATPQLSVRATDGGAWGRVPAPPTTAAVADDQAAEQANTDGGQQSTPPQSTPEGACPTTLDPTTVRVGHRMHGYIKAVTKAGAFAVLARNVEARVRLNQLQDGFVKDPAAAFPVGRLFEGRVVGVKDGRYV